MGSKIFRLILLLLFFGKAVHSQNNKEPLANQAFYTSVNKWFLAWELINKEVYRFEKTQPVAFVFFDDKLVYSNSDVTIPSGQKTNGPKLLNAPLDWKVTPHQGSIVMPDKKSAPVGLMSFASELKDAKTNSFFVMPLLPFWASAGVSSKELGLDNLVTGVFLHEFSHSQQMLNFGKKITEFETANQFGIEFSDDIVQHLFQKDTSYTEIYKKENTYFSEALAEPNISLKKDLLRNGIVAFKERQQRFFKDKYANLGQIDDFFLTMEGFGQFTMYAWLVHPKGANLSKDLAIKGTRRGGKWWSQDQGLVLFLLLDQLSAPQNWAKQMFGAETTSIISLIEKELAKK